MGDSWEPRPSSARPGPLDLAAFLPYASNELQAPFCVKVVPEIQEEYVSKADDHKSKRTARGGKSTTEATSHTRLGSQERDDADSRPSVASAYEDANEVSVATVYDAAGHRLVGLGFVRCRQVPRLLVKIIAMCVPYQPFLTRLTVRRSRLGGAALHEIAKLVPLSQLTDICLDDSPVPEGNYHLLFELEQIKRISLARCKLDDDSCVALAAKLAFPLPASKNLCLLSLVSNAIADVGACALALTLRSNRSLLYLNLAGNRITDVGAVSMLGSLGEFPLTYNELVTKRRRFVEYLQRRREVFLRCLGELTAVAERTADDGRGAGRRRTMAPRSRKGSATTVAVGTGSSTLDAIALKAEAMATDVVGVYSDPFAVDETTSRDGYVYSLGNTALCCLNLSHNNLGFRSAVALLQALRHQSALAHKTGAGLLRVMLDGNALPAECRELLAIGELLDNAVQWKNSKPVKKPERAKSKAK